MSLQGKVALITGASSGIGAATARALSGSGMSLLLNGRRMDRLEELRSQLPHIRFLAGDITNPLLPAQLLEAALNHYGRCDVVINNAGVIETGAIESIDIERVSEMVRVNVEAAYRMAHVATKHFAQVGQGHLINTSSVLGTKVRPTAGAYAGTKFAIEALWEALRLELSGSRIKVSCIQPGLVVTELHRDYEVHPKETLGISHPLLPEDVAQCILFVLHQPEHVTIPRLMVLPQESPL